jgi:hypothetical protein
MVMTITSEQFKQLLPKGYKGNVTDEVIDSINNALSDPIHQEAFKENLLSYTSVMNDGRFKIGDYINAVKYVSLKLMGHSNIRAYLKVFPDNHQRFIDEGTSDKDISAYVAAYNKNKLVNLIMAQTLTPHYVLNQHLYQEALNTQADLMVNAKSEKVRSDAANSLLVHLKPPENVKIELDIGSKAKDSIIDGLKQTLAQLSAMQKENIALGVSTTKEVAHSNLIIDGEFTEVNSL